MMRQVSLTVTGMSCTRCERIAAELGTLDGVITVGADHSSGIVVVGFDPGAVEEAAIVGRLGEAGFETMGRSPDDAR